MKTRFHIGVDASKGKACFHIQSQDLSVVRKDSFDADCDGMGRLLKRLRSLGAEPSASVVAIEATGLHHVNWCELLACAGYAVYALNPLISKRCYSPGNAIRDAKSDPLDAEGLCRIAGSPELSSLERFRYRSSAASFALKRLLCVYKAQRKALTSLLLSAGDLLDFAFPELRSIRLTLVHKGLVRLLLEHPGAESISRLSIGELQGYVGSKAGQLLKAARSSSCPPELARGSGEALRCALASIQQLRSSLEATQSSVESALRACVDARRERLARSILGFGRKTTANVLAFIPESLIRENGKKKAAAKLQALFGCDPRVKESGKHKGRTKISKRGISIARTALFQASWAAVMHEDPELKPYYDRLKARGKKHVQAMIDVMRKQLRRLVAVLKDEKPFQYR